MSDFHVNDRNGCRQSTLCLYAGPAPFLAGKHQFQHFLYLPHGGAMSSFHFNDIGIFVDKIYSIFMLTHPLLAGKHQF